MDAWSLFATAALQHLCFEVIKNEKQASTITLLTHLPFRLLAAQALSKTGVVLNTTQLRVLPSKTAIVPVNKELMPRTCEELERCSRTVYVANIDKKNDMGDVKKFFEQLCGKVSRIRLLGDFSHSTRIAFVEFNQVGWARGAIVV